MDVDGRIGRLERRVRVLSALLGLAVVGMLCGAGGGVPKEVRARAFVLEGPNGRVLGRWSYEQAPGGRACMTELSLYDARKRGRVGLVCADDGMGLVGVYGAEDDVATLSVGPDGEPQIRITDAKGRTIYSRP